MALLLDLGNGDPQAIEHESMLLLVLMKEARWESNTESLSEKSYDDVVEERDSEGGRLRLLSVWPPGWYEFSLVNNGQSSRLLGTLPASWGYWWSILAGYRMVVPQIECALHCVCTRHRPDLG